jgi:hypothetical protein
VAWYLVFWRNRSTATVVPDACTSQARSRAQHKQKKGYWGIVAARRANADDSRLIRRGVWVGLPRFGGQVSGLHGLECTGVDELLLVVDRAEVTDR